MRRSASTHAARAGIVAMLLAGSATALAAGPSQAARAGTPARDVLQQGQPSAPETVAELRDEVARVGDRLAVATLAWERSQQRLGQLISRKVSTERASEQLGVDTRAAQGRASAFAASLYRNPYDPALVALMSGSVRSIGDVFVIRRVLGRTQQLQQQDLSLLSSREQRSKDLVRRHDEAAVAAIRLQTQLEDDLTRLTTDAQTSLARLQAAVAEIRRRAAAAAAATLGSAQATGRGATCDGALPATAINGFLPISALCPLTTAPGQRLIAPVAAAFDRMSTAFTQTFGKPICVTDSYRDYATQVQVFRTKPNLAATPGRSQHGWGRAVDLCGGVQNYGTPPYVWLKQHATEYGFHHPDWAEPDGSRPEPWHWEFTG